jgi:LacI family transcriptional regulator
LITQYEHSEVAVAVSRADVARLAGTSPAVVSYVLNDGPRGVADGTRARVLAAVEALGYQPNGVARGLRMRRTMSLGLVVPDTANPFFAELARAIEEQAYRLGYALLIGNAAEDDAQQSAYVKTFLGRQVDGLLVVPAHGPASCLPDLNRTATPWLTLDRELAGARAAAVLVDNRAGAREATAHLLSHGRRRVACIAGPQDVMPATDRVAGWRDALGEAGVPPSEMSVWHGAFGRRAGYESAVVALTGREFDAIFVASDEQAAGVLRALADLGLRCPQDVAVASFDGIAESAFTIPGLTTMAQPFEQIAHEAVSALMRQIGDAGAEQRSVVLPATLVRRGSCGCDAPSDAGSLSRRDGPGEQVQAG